jgi:iron complex transport system substrate-binding protein
VRIIFTIAACSALCGEAAAGPRVLSADYCADQYVLALADRDDIAALSPEARLEFSRFRDAAAGLPQSRPTLEEAIGRGAALVLRSWGGDPSAFERAGVKVVTLDDASDFDAIRGNIRRAAEALAAEDRGAALIAALDARLSALAAEPPTVLAALYVTPGGVTAGRKTLIDAMFRAAGVDNAAGDETYWPSLPLETLVEHPPAFVVAGFFNSAEVAADNWSAARHPAFKRLFAGARVIHLPADILSCPAWFVVDGAEAIRRAAAVK